MMERVTVKIDVQKRLEELDRLWKAGLISEKAYDIECNAIFALDTKKRY